MNKSILLLIILSLTACIPSDDGSVVCRVVTKVHRCDGWSECVVSLSGKEDRVTIAFKEYVEKGDYVFPAWADEWVLIRKRDKYLYKNCQEYLNRKKASND